jgi:hypothetical protein
MSARVERLLESVLASLAELHLRVDELDIAVAQRPPTVIMTTMGLPNEIELDDDVVLPPVAPVSLRLVIDNEHPGGPDARD